MSTETARRSDPHPVPATPTRDLAEWVAGIGAADVSAQARAWAKHAILDCLGVTVAGAREPLCEILVADALAEQGGGRARLVGRAERVAPSQAALLNGAAAHALDYDDVHMLLHGHPSAPVLPALLALAEQRQASGADLLDAFVVGYEVECRIGEMLGDDHYQAGWHSTATVGTFGAAAACAKLLGLNAEQTAMALGVAAAQAAGLKSMFGTMTKPLHAGKAAQNGLLAARLAARGFTSRPDALECDQGFAATQGHGFAPLPVRPDPRAPFAVEANLFKYHAACYLTHSSIEAVAALRREHGLAPEQVARVRVRVDPGHLRVCNIPAPQTGLQIKFSLRHTVSLALCGDDTGALDTYSDANARRADLVALRERVQVEPKRFDQRRAAEVLIELHDGGSLFKGCNVAIPASDLDAQWARLGDKFRRLCDPVIGPERVAAVIARCGQLEQNSVAALLDEVSPSAQG